MSFFVHSLATFWRQNFSQNLGLTILTRLEAGHRPEVHIRRFPSPGDKDVVSSMYYYRGARILSSGPDDVHTASTSRPYPHLQSNVIFLKAKEIRFDLFSVNVLCI